jgi:hypothetical protein
MKHAARLTLQRLVLAGGVAFYITRWHDRFVGWPCGTAHPTTKDSIGNWVRRIRDGHNEPPPDGRFIETSRALGVMRRR